MRIITLALGFLLLGSMLFGQADSNSVTVTASRNVNVAPDQASFQARVDTGFDAGLEDVIAALQGSGITAANFSSLSFNTAFNVTLQRYTDVLSWQFGLNAPLAKMKDTITMLTSLQQSIPKKNSGWQLSFSVYGAETSAQALQTLICPTQDLLSDARAQAQKLASAGGLQVGPVLAMSGTTPGAPIGLGLVSSPTVPCSLTVKFALVRF